jgi:serine/threonine-protein kinase SRPK3
LDLSSEEEEEEEEYKKGGYHPVSLGNVFHSRYRITAKLGWGHFSTVWLASDLSSTRSEKVIALKIVKSAQHYTEAAKDEIKILQKTTQEDPNNDMCVIRLVDSFQVCGVNGNHVAMAFEKLGCNLLTLIRMYKYKGLPIPLVRIIAKQVLIGVDFLQRCQIIHTDLKPENVLLVKTPNIVRTMKSKESKHSGNKPQREDEKDGNEGSHNSEDSVSMEVSSPVPIEKEEPPQPPDSEPAAAKPSEPPSETTTESVSVLSKPSEEELTQDNSSPTGLPNTDEEIIKTFGDCYKIKIVDLGNACWTFKHFTDDVQTRQYRAPEVILGAKYDTPIDVWSVACIVFELLTGDLLFEPKAGKTFEKDDDHLAQMQELLGRMPHSFTQTGKFARNFFNRKGELRYIKHLKFWPLRDVFIEKYKFTEKTAQEAADFILPMLAFIPSERATAKEMLNDPWIKDIDINDFTSCFK